MRSTPWAEGPTEPDDSVPPTEELVVAEAVEAPPVAPEAPPAPGPVAETDQAPPVAPEPYGGSFFSGGLRSQALYHEADRPDPIPSPPSAAAAAQDEGDPWERASLTVQQYLSDQS